YRQATFSQPKHPPVSMFEVRGSRFDTMQCSLILKVNTARKTINRKRFLGEHERTVDSMFDVRSSRFETPARC
ncbi:MAG: hypothetical protein FWC60_00860, partial [Firmicutes bacterium]|nr:hypothetical protein [Bacillota bacterium]